MTSLPLQDARANLPKQAPEPATDPKRADGHGLHRLIYLSRSCARFRINAPLEPLNGIIQSSEARNKALRIAGVLLYNGNHFAQVLEGLHRDVEAVFAAIKHDPRHDEIMVLEDNAIAERTFAAWSVRYLDMSDGTEIELCSTPTCDVSLESERQATSLIALLRYCVQTT